MILCGHEFSSELTFIVGAKDPTQGKSVLNERFTTQKANGSIPVSGISGLPGALVLVENQNKISFKEIMLFLLTNFAVAPNNGIRNKSDFRVFG